MTVLRLSAKGMRYVVAAALIAILPVWGVFHDHNLAAGFATISNGMSQDTVKVLLGRPRDVRDCRSGEFVPRSLSDCVETYVYASVWAPLNPEYPVIWFNRDKQVIGKYDFSSP